MTLWSRFPLDPLPTSDPARSAAARIRPESGPPFIVFGTVLPWLGSQWRGFPSKGSVAFRAALSVQSADWMAIRRNDPDVELFVLGDLNQDLVRGGPRYYGSRANRIALESALLDAGLVALTAADGDPIRRDSAPSACIDHICARSDSSWRVESTARWPNAPRPDRRLSDHFGLSVTLLPRANHS